MTLTSVSAAVKSMEQKQQRPADSPELAAVKIAERAIRDVVCWRCFIRVNPRVREEFITSLKQAFEGQQQWSTDLEAQLLLAHRKSVAKVTVTFLSNGQRDALARGGIRRPPRRKELFADASTQNTLNIVPGGHTQGSTNGASSPTTPWDHMSALDHPLYVLPLPRELPSWTPLLCDSSQVWTQRVRGKQATQLVLEEWKLLLLEVYNDTPVLLHRFFGGPGDLGDRHC